MVNVQEIPVENDQGIIIARQTARQLAISMGFGVIDQSRIATAVSELARNIVRYATGSSGIVSIGQVTDQARNGIEIVASDSGPGISDVDLVMQDGYTSGNGMGLGLPGTKRLMDEMNIESALGRGTVVTIRKWRR